MERKQSLRTKILLIMLGVGMSGVILVSFFLAGALVLLSHEIAKVEPTLIHMRVPVLIMAETVVALFIAACLVSMVVLWQIWRNKVYSSLTVRLVMIMSGCFFLMIVPAAALIFYTRAHVAGSITNLWVKFGIFLSLVAGCLFALFAHLVEQGRRLKNDVDLTI